MNPTISEVNIKTSIKKGFRDYFENREEAPIPIMFDKTVGEPYVAGRKGDESTVHEWITVNFIDKLLDDVSIQVVEIYICSRQDPDGLRIEEMVDDVNAFLFPENKHFTLPFYNVETEEVIGTIFFHKRKYTDSGIQLGADGTKFCLMTVPFRWIASL